MSELVQHALELMRPWASVTARRMFGGHGLYRDGLMFALEAYDTLYVKVDGETKPTFTAAGCRPFVYQGPGRTVEMSYWTVPPETTESPSEMARWCALGWQAALRAQAARPAKKAAKKSTEKTSKARRKSAKPAAPARAKQAPKAAKSPTKSTAASPAQAKRQRAARRKAA